LQTIRALIPRHGEAGSVAAFRHGVRDGPNDKAPPFGGALRNLLLQASATLVVLTTAVLTGILRLLTGLLATTLLLATLVLATLVLSALLLPPLVLATLVLSALMLTTLVLLPALMLSALAGIIGVLIHHVLSCCPCLTIKGTAKQRFQSRQY
jgi:hypothetical protein